MKSLRLFIFSLLVSLSSIQLLLATEVQISLYGGGIYFSEINKDEYKDKYYVFINNRYISKDKMNNILIKKNFIYKVTYKGEFINGIYNENNDK